MTPLTVKSLKNLLERISYAREGEIRSLTPLTPTSIEIRFSVQDIARGYDWIDVVFVVNGVKDARLANGHALKMISMDEGITVEIEPYRASIAIGEYAGRIEEAPLFITGETISYEECPFTE